jgi:transcriptional regulator with XRE-family HTH domain
MANRRRVVAEASERWQRAWIDLADELREARLAAGLTQAQVASGLGVSRDRVGRVERRRVVRLPIDYVFRHAAVVGLKASLKFYPMGGGLRDEASARYTALFLARIGHAWQSRLEVRLPIPGDLRAIDIVLFNGSTRIAVEVITRLRDLQAQIRAAALKQHELGAARLILVVAGSHANRRAIATARPTMLASFDTDTRAIFARLVAGEDPGRDAMIVLR